MTIDFSFITDSAFSNPFSVTWFLIAHGGWIVVLLILLIGGYFIWRRQQQVAYEEGIEFIVLAIDVPKMTEQTPKAVESVFSHIHGVQKKGNWVDRNLHGYWQVPLSFEIVSVGGYIQFLTRIPKKYRDLVESAFYAQYPDAEISEVGEYAEAYKPTFPNDSYDLWGADIKLSKSDVFPIRTYPMFEHTMTQQLLDPLASLLEFLSRLHPGEEAWIQVLIAPPDDNEWIEKARDVIRKLAHSKIGGEKKGGGLGDVAWLPRQVLSGLTETFTADLVSPFGEKGEDSKEQTQPSLMSFLTPDTKETIAQVAYKAAKLYYETKLRIVYIAQKNVFDKSRVSGLVGALKQFTSLDTNGFVVDKKTKTTVDYYRKEQREASRKRKILRAYQERSMERGTSSYVMNVEELASIFHFPVVTVKAPLVQKTEARKGEPPRMLPIESPFEERRQPDAPPTNLPA
jgi:hypothetical protein